MFACSALVDAQNPLLHRGQAVAQRADESQGRVGGERVGPEDKSETSWAKSLGRAGEPLGDGPDRPGRQDVVLGERFEVFDPGPLDLDPFTQRQRVDSGSKERHPALPRLHQPDGRVGAEHGEDQTGKSRACTQVDDPSVRWEPRRGGQGIADELIDDGLGV